jgi:hypothetical protein
LQILRDQIKKLLVSSGLYLIGVQARLNVKPMFRKQKPSITFGELNDVTLGSSAIFESQSRKERS